jgi:hypothetical protein
MTGPEVPTAAPLSIKEIEPNSPFDILPYPVLPHNPEIPLERPGDKYRPAKYEHNYAL